MSFIVGICLFFFSNVYADLLFNIVFIVPLYPPGYIPIFAFVVNIDVFVVHFY